MTLVETITQNMKEAMKAKDSATLSTLRMLLSAIKNKQIDLQHDLTDAEIQDVVKTQTKQLKDSVESFSKGGRDDMASEAQAEILVLEQFLPAQLSDEELLAIVKEVVDSSGVTSRADMGKVMGSAVAAVAGRADGGRVKNVVSSLLSVFVLTIVGWATFSSQAWAAVPLVENFSSGSAYAEFLLRIFRVLVLWLGIPAVILILNAGFQYMTASYRDGEHEEAMHKLTLGLFSTILIAALFSFSTVILQKMN